jgi:hypothetical protein
MKHYLHFLLLMATMGMYGHQANRCGLDNSPALTDDEAAFLNDYFDEDRKGFDFKGKKVLILGGDAGLSLYGKSDYFQSIKERLETDALPVASAPYPFTEEEKAKSGGYDAILTLWVKVPMTDSKKARVARRVGEGIWEVPGA